MIKKKALFVLGAGASYEAKLPTGDLLKQKISSLLKFIFNVQNGQTSGDKLIAEALRVYVRENTSKTKGDINPYISAAQRINGALPQAKSIDNFIDTHQGNEQIELCGKLAIVRSILEAERNSLLYVNPANRYASINFSELGETWYNSLMMMLTEGCRRESLPERLSQIGFIIFNYDRCIEHFLFYSLQNYYGLSDSEAASLVKEVDIFHPYGTVGNLPWYGDNEPIGFGAEPSARSLVNLASRIKTFTEGTDPESSDVLAIREALVRAEKVVFLGFAFHPINLDLLQSTPKPTPEMPLPKWYATAKGISESDCKMVMNDLCKLGGLNHRYINLRNDLSCAQLFKEYGRSLSLV